MRQIARNLLIAKGFLRECRFLIHDRATVLTKEFVSILKCAGVDDQIRVARSSDSGGGTIAPAGFDNFRVHYHGKRNHQRLENKLIEADFGVSEAGELKCPEGLGGLLRYYHREAA